MRRIFTNFLNLLVLLSSAFAYQLASAQTGDEYFMLGNNAYKNGDFERAKQDYESAIKSGFKSAETYYNLANTNAKLGKRGDALLNYMRAIYANPRMPEANANIKMFAKDASLDLPQKTPVYEILSELSQSEWTVIAFVTFWSAVLLIFIPPLYSHGNMATVFLAITGIVIFIISIVAISNWRDYAQTAIAIAPDVELRLSPTDTAPSSAIVSEGQIGSILRKHANFIYVETPNGKRGWADSKDFAPIVE